MLLVTLFTAFAAEILHLKGFGDGCGVKEDAEGDFERGLQDAVDHAACVGILAGRSPFDCLPGHTTIIAQIASIYIWSARGGHKHSDCLYRSQDSVPVSTIMLVLIITMVAVLFWTVRLKRYSDVPEVPERTADVLELVGIDHRWIDLAGLNAKKP